VSVSFIWIDIGANSPNQTKQVENPERAIDSIHNEIKQTFERRDLYKHFVALEQFGNDASPLLISYLSNPDPVLREFAANQLGNMKSKEAVETLILALNDENWRVKNSAVIALASIGDEKAIGPIMELVRNTPPEERFRFFSLLGSFKVEEAWPILVDGTNELEWYKKVAALRALSEISLEKAKPYIYKALKDTQYQVRRQTVFMLLELKPSDAIVPLQNVLNDEDFETRFYANEAIKLIEKKNK
jgi:HEAT repeat protein